jgi:hypothetical protein
VRSTDVDADCVAASAAIAQDEPELAAAHACAALRLDPRCGRAWMSLMLALRLAGRPGYSVLAARGAAHALPTDVDVLVACALAHEAAGDVAGAVEGARAVLAQDGRHREARGILARSGVHGTSVPGDSPAVAVVVRVGDEPDDVVRLLDRLALQEPGGPPFEVALCGVDGVSVLVLPGPRPFPLHHAHAATEAAAWNAGWRATTAPVVLFLEPDAVPGPEVVAACLREHAREQGVVRAGARLHPHRSDPPCAPLLFARRQAAAPARMHALSVPRDVLVSLGGFTGDYGHADAVASDLCARASARRERMREATEWSVSRRSPADPGSVLDAEEVLGSDAVAWVRTHGTPAPWDDRLDGAALACARARVEAERAEAEEWSFVVAQACHLGPSSEPGGRVAVETCLTRLAAWRRLCGALATDASMAAQG